MENNDIDGKNVIENEKYRQKTIKVEKLTR